MDSSSLLNILQTKLLKREEALLFKVTVLMETNLFNCQEQLSQ
jgi:hypothetical protein